MTLRVSVPDELEERLRKKAMERFGYEKGSISKAVTTAIESWLDTVETTEPIQDPWERLEGALDHIDKSSVELQDEALRIWAKTVDDRAD